MANKRKVEEKLESKYGKFLKTIKRDMIGAGAEKLEKIIRESVFAEAETQTQVL
jgi:hypothetical protein